jgi:steroid delta-isomerase-like uncharacterized protein
MRRWHSPISQHGRDCGRGPEPQATDGRSVEQALGKGVDQVSQHATAALVERFYVDLWNQWEDRAVDEVLADDFRFRGSLGEETVGRNGWRRYRDAVRAGASDFHNELQTLVVDGSHAAARLLYTGTHDGTFAGVPATGRRFSYAGAAFFTARDGLLVDAWVLGDLASLRGQLEPDVRSR